MKGLVASLIWLPCGKTSQKYMRLSYPTRWRIVFERDLILGPRFECLLLAFFVILKTNMMNMWKVFFFFLLLLLSWSCKCDECETMYEVDEGGKYYMDLAWQALVVLNYARIWDTFFLAWERTLQLSTSMINWYKSPVYFQGNAFGTDY